MRQSRTPLTVICKNSPARQTGLSPAEHLTHWLSTPRGFFFFFFILQECGPAGTAQMWVTAMKPRAVFSSQLLRTKTGTCVEKNPTHLSVVVYGYIPLVVGRCGIQVIRPCRCVFDVLCGWSLQVKWEVRKTHDGRQHSRFVTQTTKVLKQVFGMWRTRTYTHARTHADLAADTHRTSLEESLSHCRPEPVLTGVSGTR